MIKIKITKKPKFRGAIVVLLDKKGRTLLLLRPRQANWAPLKWGFPGGKIEAGETPRQAAIRETSEETQLDVENLKSLNLGVDKSVAIYYTRDYMGTIKLDHEHNDWAWVSRVQMQDYDLAPDVLETYDWALQHG